MTMPYIRILLFLYLFFISKIVCAWNFSLEFTNVSSIDDSNLEEINVIYRCNYLKSQNNSSSSDTSNKFCNSYESSALNKANEYCEKKNLFFKELTRNQIKRNSEVRDYSNGYGFGFNTEQFDTAILFKCVSQADLQYQPDQAIKDQENERELEFYKELDKEKNRENSRPQGIIRTPHNGKNTK